MKKIVSLVLTLVMLCACIYPVQGVQAETLNSQQAVYVDLDEMQALLEEMNAENVIGGNTETSVLYNTSENGDVSVYTGNQHISLEVKEGNLPGQLFADIIINNNPLVEDSDKDNEISEYETAGISAYQLKVGYDDSLFAISQIVKMGNYEGQIVANKEAGIAVWTNAEGLYENTDDGISGIKNGAIIRFVFEISRNITDSDYERVYEFALDSTSNAVNSNHTYISIDNTAKSYQLPDVRPELDDIIIAPVEKIKYTGDVIDPADTVRVDTLPADEVTYTSEPSVIKEPGKYKVTATVRRAGYKAASVTTEIVVGLCTYKFVDEDGTVISEGELYHGQPIPEPETIPYKEATQQYVYSFSGWGGYEYNMSITDDVVFTASYERYLRRYTYKFVDGDKVYKTATAYYGAHITEPDTKPENVGNRIFTGWKGYTTGMVITEDITFEAEFENVDLSKETSLYLKSSKGAVAGQIFVDVAIRNNPVVVDADEDGIISDTERVGVSAFQLIVDYNKDKFTLSAIRKIGKDDGSYTNNKATATSVWVSPGGLYTSYTDDETYETTIEGLAEADFTRYVFNVNYANVTEEEYGQSFEFKFADESNAAGAMVDFTPVACIIEDTREPIAGLVATPVEGLAYTGEVIDPATTITLGGTYNAGTDTVVYKADEIKNAGTYTVTAEVTRPGSKKTEVSANVVIGKKDIEVVMADYTITYGDALPVFSHDAPAGVEITPTVEENPNAGTVAITATANDTTGNYNVTVVPGTLTVAKKAITVTMNDASMTYGDALPEFTSDAPNGVTITPTVEAKPNAGTVAITATAESKNYDVTVIPGTLTVNKKAITITVHDEFQVQGNGIISTFKPAVVEGLVGGDEITNIVVGLKETYTDVEGDYAIEVKSYDDNANYEVTTIDGIYQIKAAIPVNVIFGENRKTYGAPDDAEIVATGDVDKVTITRVKGLDKAAAGTYEDAYEVTLKEAEDASGIPYALNVANNKFVVEKKTATIRINDAVKTREDADPEFTFTLEGFLEGDEPTEISFAREEGEAVGDYEITAFYDDPNYVITVENAKLTIKKKTFTVVFKNWDNTVLESKVLEEGTQIHYTGEAPIREATAQYSYSFVGWDKELGTIDANIEFKAVFDAKVNQYTYKFFDEEGKIIEEKTADYGTIIIAPEAPVKESNAQYTYTFKEWSGYTEEMMLTKNVEFTAVFDTKINQYTYKFLNEDGSVYLEKTVDYGTVIYAPEKPADKPPYAFEKWLDYTEGTIITKDVEFKAVYKPMDYNISVYDEEGNIAEIKTVTYDTEFTLNVLSKEEYDFFGYYTQKNGKGTQLTDAEGNSIGQYDTVGNISAYPYLKNIYSGKFVVESSEKEVGTKEVSIPVQFATLDEGNMIALVVKIPEMVTEYQFVAKDFKVVEIEKTKINNGYVEVSILALYDEEYNNVPVNQKIVPFEIKINIPETAVPGEYEIIADEVELYGEETSFFETVQSGKIKVLPKLAESVTIEGKTFADAKTKYTAIVYPDYTTNKEVKWTVSDETVATIDENGMLTPLKNGAITVIATAADGSQKSGAIEVEVVKYSELEALKVTGFELNKDFNKEDKAYTIYVDSEITEIELTATFEGNGTINGNLLRTDREKTVTLTGEETEIKITVKQNECTETTYTIKVIQTPKEAKLEIKETGEEKTKIEVTLPKEMMEKSKVYVIVKAHNKEGMQIHAKGKEVTNETNKVSVDLPKNTGAEKYKALFWESLANLKPVYAPIEK